MDKGTRNTLIALGLIVIGGGAYLFFTRDKGKKGKGKGNGLFKGLFKGGGKGKLAERFNTLITTDPEIVEFSSEFRKIKDEVGDDIEKFREEYFDKYNEYPVVTSSEKYDGKGLKAIMVYAWLNG